MGFLRRGRRRPKGAKAPPEPAQQQSGSSTQPAVHRTSGAALPAGKASSSSKSTSTSSVTPTTGPALNKLPPGMPTMPETPPEYARLAERKVSDIDERFNSARRSLSFDSADSRGWKNRRRLRHVFGRSPRSRRSRSSAGSTGSASNRRLSDVPVADGEASSVGLLSLAAGLACAPSDYDQAPHAPEEDPASRLKVSDLNTKGRLLLVEETMTEPVRVHDELVSFVVPHGWSATRTAWGFYLVCKDCLGFIMASSAQDATKHLIDTQKLSVLSDVHVMSSPLFESKHRAVVQYASLDLEGKG